MRKSGREHRETMRAAVRADAAGRIVLVGTYRPENADWIAAKRLYNLPLPKCGRLAFHVRVGGIVLFAEGARPLAFKARFKEVADRVRLAALGYSLAAPSKAHGEVYALYELTAETTPLKLLGRKTAEVYVCSSRCPVVRIDAAFYAKPYPKTGGSSMPQLFDSLRPYVEKGLTATAFDPVQMEFMTTMFPERKFPETDAIVYVKGAIVRHCQTEKRFPPTEKGKPFRLGEFFCGPGGLACGAMSAKIENPNFRIVHAWANDFDRQTCETYVENICPDHRETVICHDVRKLSLEDKTLTPIDGFAFGFPCNDFSVVGEHKGIDGNYGPLYQYGVAVLRKFKPLWFVAENVGGLASANEGAAFRTILASMKDAGYRVYPHLYKFEDYGVPQSRHRIIIVGIRSDQPYRFFPPSPEALERRDNSARAALETPPIPQNVTNNERTAMNPRVVERLNYIKPGQNAFSADLPAHLKLHVKGAKISQIYKRLNPDKPAYTVTGSGGGGTHIYHYAEPRALTNRERARLQTFPDAYLFTGKKESVRKQIGMAVPPRGARIIFEAILRTFAGIEYKHTLCNISDNGDFGKGATS